MIEQGPSPGEQGREDRSQSGESSRATQREHAVDLNTSFSPSGSGASRRWGVVGGALAALGGMFAGGAEALPETGPDTARFNSALVSTMDLQQETLANGQLSPEVARRVERWILQSFDPEADDWDRIRAERSLADLDPGAQRLLPVAWRAAENLPESAPEWQREAYRLFISTRQIGIEYPNRIPREHLDEIVTNRMNLTPDGRPLAIFVWPKGDHNGAFYAGANEYDEMIRAGYRVLYFEVESDTQMIESLVSGTRLGTSAEQRASIIILGGHGSRERLWFERDSNPLPNGHGTVDLNDEELFWRAGVAQTLAENGQIILDSCSNGEGGATNANVANFMRRVFPHAMPRGIWSATESYLVEHFTFDENGALVNVNFHVPEYRAFRPGPGELPELTVGEADIRV